TYMPAGGVEHRARQLALLAGLQHARSADARVGELLEALEGSGLFTDPASAAAVNVRELRRVYDRARRVPRSLVEELALATALAQQEWSLAREVADFTLFRPWLERIVHLKRCEAECLVVGKDSLYDALLEEYEPGVRGEDVARLLGAIRDDLLPLIDALAGAPRRPDLTILTREYPVPRQSELAELTAAAIGFDFARGRLDTTTHPFFSSVGPGDCRLATR